jgi:hypothetical protein
MNYIFLVRKLTNLLINTLNELNFVVLCSYGLPKISPTVVSCLIFKVCY